MISNACRTALALAGFHYADQDPCGYSLTESQWVLFCGEFMCLSSDTRDFFLSGVVFRGKRNHPEKRNIATMVIYLASQMIPETELARDDVHKNLRKP